MRILIVHNRYQHAGGEDAVEQAEGALLESNGHRVVRFEVTNDNIKGLGKRVSAALNVVYSKASLELVSAKIAQFRPDIVHVHNFFPLLTPSVYDACGKAGLPVVQTLHNYRTICPGALLMRNGEICEKCIKGSPYCSIIHSCYRGSRFGTFAVVRMVAAHRKRGTWRTKVDRFIALTNFSKSKFVEAGFPREKIAVKPNFFNGKALAPSDNGRAGALFVGRLSLEKGVNTLMKAWEGLDIPLRVAGDGPLLETLRRSGLRDVTPLGAKPGPEVMGEMHRAAFLVMPSECYEGFPIVIAESLAQGLPVIASRLGSMAELIDDGVTGLHFTAGDPSDLAAKVKWASEHPDEMKVMGQNARDVYEKRYTPETNYKQLMEIYQDAIAERNNRSTQ